MAGPLRVSSSTVSRRLRIGAGLKARKPAVKPVLTDAQKQRRSFQLNTFIPRLLEGCNLVWWKDFFFGCSWSFVGSPIRQYQIQPVNIYRGGRNTRKTVNTWACMSFSGPGRICMIDGRLNSISYLNILENELVPYVEDSYPLSDYTMNWYRFFFAWRVIGFHLIHNLNLAYFDSILFFSKIAVWPIRVGLLIIGLMEKDV